MHKYVHMMLAGLHTCVGELIYGHIRHYTVAKLQAAQHKSVCVGVHLRIVLSQLSELHTAHNHKNANLEYIKVNIKTQNRESNTSQQKEQLALLNSVKTKF